MANKFPGLAEFVQTSAVPITGMQVVIIFKSIIKQNIIIYIFVLFVYINPDYKCTSLGTQKQVQIKKLKGLGILNK